MLDAISKSNANKTHRVILLGAGAAFALVLEDEEALVAEPASIFTKKRGDLEKLPHERMDLCYRYRTHLELLLKCIIYQKVPA
jgi:hypothetical protein